MRLDDNDNDTNNKVSFLNKVDFLDQLPREKAETMKSFTLASFVNADQLPEEPKTWLDLVPQVVYDKFISNHLTVFNQTCVELAKTRGPQPSIRPFWNFFPENITNREMDDVVKSDADKSEDDSWDQYDLDDDYDREYNPDLLAEWDEPHSDAEYDDSIDDEKDKW